MIRSWEGREVQTCFLSSSMQGTIVSYHVLPCHIYALLRYVPGDAELGMALRKPKSRMMQRNVLEKQIGKHIEAPITKCRTESKERKMSWLWTRLHFSQHLVHGLLFRRTLSIDLVVSVCDGCCAISFELIVVLVVIDDCSRLVMSISM